MKIITFLIALLWVAICNPLWSAEVDTVWVSDFKGEISFQHSITKNLVLEASNKLIELDSKNGNVLSELPYTNVSDNKPYISKDGTKLLHTNVDDTYIYEYPSMELITKLEYSTYSKFLNNNEIISKTYGNSNLGKYNIKTKERQGYYAEGNVQNIVTSPDGWFIAYSLTSTDEQKKWSKLILMDAKTMKNIQLLSEVIYSNFNFGQFNFTNDGKYIAFNGETNNGEYGLKIFSIEKNKDIKIITQKDNTITRYLNFIGNNLYSLKIDSSNKESVTQIIDIEKDKILIEIKNSREFIYNEELNHLYYMDTKNKKTICLNISNLITGVAPEQPITLVKYQNKQLTISKENVSRVEISDISGRIIIDKVIENPFSNNTLLQINLINGQYLINIITDKENFTHKLLVME